ncbi:cellulose binding domain-containing protein [Actinoplanes sp. NPDC024001]|uniref:cellulose binding domain-containing protein n=1 Tax=Actinoplanes sp. NPDC024001 TaxID=3154598 RepID=UPI003408DF01
MLTTRSAARLLVAVIVAAAVTLAGLLTVTGAYGSPVLPSVPAPTPSMSPLPPSAPSGLAATVIRSTAITLSWTPSRPGCCAVAGYHITWNQAFDDIYRATDAGDGTSFTIAENIRPAQQYTFRVFAYDSAGHRSLSSEAVTVVTPLSDSSADTTPPQAPAGLTVTSETPRSVALSWSPATDDVAVTGYDVYWFDGWFTSRLLATVGGTSYTAPLSAERNVFYVRARDAAGNVSIASGTVTVGSTNPTSGPPSSPPPPPPACAVSYQHTAQWDRGFVAALRITNTGAAPVDGWALTFDVAGDQRITSAWNAAYAQDGAKVTLRNAHWNGSLAPGASRDVGLMGSWTTVGPAPAAFVLNGQPCRKD